MTAYEKLVKKHGEDGARQIMAERARARKDYSTTYFSKLKNEGREDELKALQAKGVKIRKETKDE